MSKKGNKELRYHFRSRTYLRTLTSNPRCNNGVPNGQSIDLRAPFVLRACVGSTNSAHRKLICAPYQKKKGVRDRTQLKIEGRVSF